MNDAFRFVHGAVSKKDLVPVLTHFCIQDGKVQGHNGWLTLCSPVDLNTTDTVLIPAAPLIKALDYCADPTIKITEESVLITEKGFRVKIPRMKEEFPWVQDPDRGSGEKNQVFGLCAALRKLAPFIGDDATRRWACGVLLRDGFAYATNNVILARTPVSAAAQDVIIPKQAVDEILRIGEEPELLIVDEQLLSLTWGERWLTTKTILDEWPNVTAFFEPLSSPSTVPTTFAEDVDKLLPFCPNPDFPVICLCSDGLKTEDGRMSAQIMGDPLPDKSFDARMLRLVAGVMKQYQATDYGLRWTGEGIEGVIAGLRE